MKKTRNMLSLLALLAMTAAHADYGYVDFGRVLSNSTRAKQEEKTLQSLQKELEDQVTNVEKEIQSLAEKLQDPDYIDSLSQEAEQEQRTRLRAMSEERMRMIQQVTGQFQQAQQRVMQVIGSMVSQASAEVARVKSLSGVLNREAFFYVDPALDCTDAVISILDKAAK
jgi:outer membrane protein